jgi:hypothetical protein
MDDPGGVTRVYARDALLSLVLDQTSIPDGIRFMTFDDTRGADEADAVLTT